MSFFYMRPQIKRKALFLIGYKKGEDLFESDLESLFYERKPFFIVSSELGIALIPIYFLL